MRQEADHRILVIDDEEDIRDTVAVILKDSGYQVATAPDGHAGLECCRDFTPQIVITDVRMPRMGGLEFLEAVKSQMPGIEVIVVTAFGEMDLAVKALQLDASDFITKPISEAALQVALKRARQRITTRRLLVEKQMADQARALHHDKMVSLGRLAASVAHEINNPLAAVLNYIRLMIRMLHQKAADDEVRHTKFAGYLDVVEKELVRCSDIVSGLLTFARKAPVSRTPVNLVEVIERSLLLSRHRLELGDITLKTDIASIIPRVQGDANQLQQCLINLIFNAIDAMPDGGHLEVTARSNADGKRVVLIIADNGHGIAEGDLPHIFEPFFTTRKEGYGTGLGLATTYGIVQDHNGTIDVRSQKGQGAVFTLTFPTLP